MGLTIENSYGDFFYIRSNDIEYLEKFTKIYRIALSFLVEEKNNFRLEIPIYELYKEIVNLAQEWKLVSAPSMDFICKGLEKIKPSSNINPVFDFDPEYPFNAMAYYYGGDSLNKIVMFIQEMLFPHKSDYFIS